MECKLGYACANDERNYLLHEPILSCSSSTKSNKGFAHHAFNHFFLDYLNERHLKHKKKKYKNDDKCIRKQIKLLRIEEFIESLNVSLKYFTIRACSSLNNTNQM